MTYWGVLAIFIIPPTLALGTLSVWGHRRSSPGESESRGPGAYFVILVHVLIAVLYTSPWDNYLVANRVWWYDPALVTGLTIGWVPVEEYAFFVLQTLMTGLWTISIIRKRVKPPGGAKPNPNLHRASLLLTAALWILSLAVLLSEWAPGRYLSLILVWGLLPFLIQLSFGGDLLLADWRRAATAVAIPTLYLWLVDALAIRSGTWTIDPLQTTGIKLGVLPLEEMVFFLITNLLIVSGITLMLSPQSRARVGAFRLWLAERWGSLAVDDVFSAGD